LLRHLDAARVNNPVFLSGDIHSFWANDLKLDFNDPDSRTVGTEFVGSSVSANPPTFDFAASLPENPHVRFFDKSVRGYVSVDLARERMVTRFRAISDRCAPNASVNTLKTFVVESGKTGATLL
jgi:alkaline phosphatase D